MLPCPWLLDKFWRHIMWSVVTLNYTEPCVVSVQTSQWSQFDNIVRKIKIKDSLFVLSHLRSISLCIYFYFYIISSRNKIKYLKKIIYFNIFKKNIVLYYDWKLCKNNIFKNVYRFLSYKCSSTKEPPCIAKLGRYTISPRCHGGYTRQDET